MNIERHLRRTEARARLLATASGLAILSTFAAAASAEAQTTNGPAAAVGEVVVTASRREETVTKLPFNISAYGAEDLQRSNVTNLVQLTQQVPNFVIQDAGARSIESAIPIIRGLNASQPVVTSARFFQSPVGFYVGNSPLIGYQPLFDVQRIEVLRGPQGTLYGAGSLSGAVRVVPNDPKLGEYSGLITGSVADLAHSSKLDNSEGLVVNLPLGEKAALRFNVKRDYGAGFIDQNDILQRQGNDYINGTPVLANPADVAGSPGVYFNKKDVNYSNTTSARAALLWQPTDRFTLNLAYNYSWVDGNGGPIDNPTYKGGASPLDPRQTLRPTGEYERSLPTLEPYSRRSDLGTIDASYDLGFATLSGTVTYGYTKGQAESDETVTLLGSPYGFYYTGSPANPRAVIPVTNPDSELNYTEEVRLVSKTGGKFDYILGGFFQQQRRFIGLDVWDPGADVQSAAAHGGSTVPIALGGTYITLLPAGMAYDQPVHQRFKDYSAYGELTWHVTDKWQITGGARFFHQTFVQDEVMNSSFFFFDFDTINRTTTNDHIFKVNTSYALDDANQVYATWSQGFRRGGANAFPTSGFVLEPIALQSYVPDKTNNFEAGIKGHYGGFRYSFDAFYILWDKPQIDLLTPYNLTAVVVNGKEATSKGVEFEMSGPLFLDGLDFSVGLAYARARLSKDFHLPAGAGGEVIDNAINGFKGDRLPGAPDFSGSVNINYHQSIWGNAVTYSLGADFRSSVLNQLSEISSNSPTRESPAYGLLHGSITFDRGDWQAQLYGTNLADRRAEYSANVRTIASFGLTGDWGNSYVISRPREIGLRLTRHW